MNSVAQSAAPLPVVAVLVTHDAPPDRLAEVLEALAAQDHPNLDVLVVETGAGDPTERVRSALPGARVHRAGGAGFGAAANVVLDLVSGAELYVFCHDDAVPAPDAVSAMVATARERGADVVGPKLVGWDDPRRFTQFGLAVDKVGVPLPYVERGELDQGQHDGLCEVFAVPGGFTLVRAGRFAQIGGFDEAITFLGDDVSLAWRARVAGARVVVSPAARVRHAEALAGRIPRHAAARLAARHRVRVLLTSCRLATLARVVPVALALSLGEAAGALATARPRRSLAALAAWPWNLVRLRSLVVARRQVRRFRAVSDRDVCAAQVRGLVGPRLTLLRAGGDGRWGAGARRVAEVPVRGRPHVDPAAWSAGTGLVAVVVAATLAFGSRHLVTRFVPVVGQVVAPGGGASDLLDGWLGGRRAVGLGAEGAVPALTGALGLLGTVLGGHAGLARTLLVVGLLPLGVVGAHRLAAPTGSKAAQVAAAVAYAAVPLPYHALGEGRWSAVAAYAAAPWMLGRLARASGVAPFGPATAAGDEAGPPGDAAGEPGVRHRLWAHVVATGAVTGLAGLVVPQAAAVVVLVGIALAAGSLLAGERRGVGRVLVAAAGGAAVAVLLHLPAARDVVTSPAGVEGWLGAGGGARGLRVPDLLAFGIGPAALAGVPFALLGAAALPLLVGRRWRLGWAVRGWAVAVACWGVVWASERGWVTADLPDPGVLLAPGAAGVALAVGLGVAAVRHDVAGRSWRFGARRIAAALALLALAASTSSLAVAALDGWWGMPRDDFAGLLGFVDDDVRSPGARVLWIGEPDLLPGGDGWRLGGELAYTASTAAAVPGVGDLWPTAARGAAGDLERAVARARAGDTSRLGEALAPLGVRYVAMPLRLAPSADPPPADTAGGATGDLAGALAGQLDLERVRVEPALVVYRNTAVGARAVASSATPADAAAEPATATLLDPRTLTGAQAVLWLAVAVVALRMRFADGDATRAAPPRPARSRRTRHSPRVAEPAAAGALAVAAAGGRGGASPRAVARDPGSAALSGSAGERGGPAARSNGRDPAEPAHLPGGRARRPRGERDRRSLVVRLVAVAVLAPALGGAVVVDAARRQPDRSAAVRSAPLMPVAPGDTGGASTWYCAAGTADDGGMADHSVAIVNTGTEDVLAGVTVHTGAVAGAGPAGAMPPPPPVEHVTVAAGGRIDVRLGDVVEAPLAAAVVEVDGGGAVVEHRVRGEHGEDVGPCSTYAADTWHFAWGSTTRDAREVVVLFNPFPSTATVDAVFATEDGSREPVRLQGLPVPGRSVVGIDLGDDVARSELVSATFRVRSGRVVAERLQQYDGSLGLRGLALGLGVPVPVAAWVLADGEASAPAPRTPRPRPGDAGDEGDDGTGDSRDEGQGGDLRTTERVVVYNPGDERAEVDVQVVPLGGDPGQAPLPFRLSVGAGDHQVVDYGEHDRVDPGGRHATVVRSTDGRPVVVERVTADMGPVPSGDEPSVDEPSGNPAARPASLAVAAGARLAATRWVVPSVVAPGRGSTVTYTVFNPGDASAEVSVDLLDGPEPARPAGVPAEGTSASGPAPAVVPPGAAVEIALGSAEADRALAGVVTAGRPVVVGYAIRAADGRRTGAALGVPVAAGAVPLTVADGAGSWGVAAG